MASGTSQSSIAQKNWELTNNIASVNSLDEIYQYDPKQQQDILDAKPWDKEWVFSLMQCYTSLSSLNGPLLVYNKLFSIWAKSILNCHPIKLWIIQNI